MEIAGQVPVSLDPDPIIEAHEKTWTARCYART
jgi:hypothetical protein